MIKKLVPVVAAGLLAVTLTACSDNPEMEDSANEQAVEQASSENIRNEDTLSAESFAFDDSPAANFVTAYNAISPSPLNYIQEIRESVYEATSFGYTFELNGTDPYQFLVQIYQKGEFDEMEDAFIDAAMALDPALDSADAQEAFQNAIDQMAKVPTDVDFDLGNIRVYFTGASQGAEGHIQLYQTVDASE